MTYNHHIIAHGKALAECLSQRRPLSDSKYKRTFINYDYINNRAILSGSHSVQPVGKEEHFASTECKHS